jgi:SAM-dependent methyltransferase
MADAQGVPAWQFHKLYEATPPWDVPFPQPAVVALAEQGIFQGDVLDSGCGTGENALFLAARGHAVVGIDLVPAAVDRAKAKAAERGLAVAFHVGDALHLTDLKQTFDTLLDSGVFHVFSDADRGRYVDQLRQMVRPGGRLVILCFSEHEPGTEGPRRVTQPELRSALADGWVIESITPTRYASHIHPGGAHAWAAVARRVEK